MADMGFWVETSSIQLSDDNSSTIQAMTLGEYSHPFYGDIKLTPERIQRFADSVNNKVRGTDLDIDYDHKEYSGIAAGWVQAAEATPAGLALKVKWTQKAADHIRNGEYKYFSPEFKDEWKHPKTKVVHKDVLFGGALTNRPFLKDIAPVNMSEVIKMETGGKSMADPQTPPAAPAQPVVDPANAEFWQQLAAYLKLPDPENATPEMVMGAAHLLFTQGKTAEEQAAEQAAQQAQQNQQGQQPPQAPPAAQQSTSSQNGAVPVAASELPAEVKALAEKNPEMAKLFADMMERQARTEAALALAEADSWTRQLNDTAAEKGFAFPPTVTTQLTELLASAPRALSDKVKEIFDAMAKSGVVALDERGYAGNTSRDGKSAVTSFSEEVAKLRQEDAKLSYQDAADLVAMNNPKLFTEYRDESTAFRI
jgi:phage I-like protein